MHLWRHRDCNFHFTFLFIFLFFFTSSYTSSFTMSFISSFTSSFSLSLSSSLSYLIFFLVNRGKTFTLVTVLPSPGNPAQLTCLAMYNSYIGVALDNFGKSIIWLRFHIRYHMTSSDWDFMFFTYEIFFLLFASDFIYHNIHNDLTRTYERVQALSTYH